MPTSLTTGETLEKVLDVVRFIFFALLYTQVFQLRKDYEKSLPGEWKGKLVLGSFRPFVEK